MIRDESGDFVLLIQTLRARMLVAAALIAACCTGFGSAAAAASARLVVGGTVSPTCTVSGTASTITLGDVSLGASASAGTVGFSCNLVDTGPTVSVTSSNHGLLREGGSETIAYTMSWPLTDSQAFADFGAAQGAASAVLPAIAPGAMRSAQLSVKVATGATGGMPAGTYRDVVILSISP